MRVLKKDLSEAANGYAVVRLSELPLEVRPIEVIGGLPCQAFSMSNVHKRSDAKDPRLAHDEEYFEIMAGALRVCAEDKPMFGQGRTGGLRKAGGELSDAGRGTNAIAGAVDALIRLNRTKGKHPDTYRQLEFIGRFPGPGGPMILDRQTADSGSRYEMLGNDAAVKSVDAQQAILNLLSEENELTMGQIMDAAQLDRNAARLAISRLLDDGLIVRLGEGRKDDPYRFQQTPI